MDFVKINSDGAFRESILSGGWGFTIRNIRGEVLAVGAGNLVSIANSLQAEALAMLHATPYVGSCKNGVYQNYVRDGLHGAEASAD